MPQEKGIPRRIELRRDIISFNTRQSVGSSQKPSFYDFYYIACAVTSNKTSKKEKEKKWCGVICIVSVKVSILLADTDTDTSTKVSILISIPQVLKTTLGVTMLPHHSIFLCGSLSQHSVQSSFLCPTPDATPCFVLCLSSRTSMAR
jgi:hypothetical protein